MNSDICPTANEEVGCEKRKRSNSFSAPSTGRKNPKDQRVPPIYIYPACKYGGTTPGDGNFLKYNYDTTSGNGDFLSSRTGDGGIDQKDASKDSKVSQTSEPITNKNCYTFTIRAAYILSVCSLFVETPFAPVFLALNFLFIARVIFSIEENKPFIAAFTSIAFLLLYICINSKNEVVEVAEAANAKSDNDNLLVGGVLLNLTINIMSSIFYMVLRAICDMSSIDICIL